MTTRTARFARGGRAGTRDRLGRFRHLLLVLPATFALISGEYSEGLPSLSGVLFLLLAGLSLIALGLGNKLGEEADSVLGFSAGVGALVALFALRQMAGAHGALILPVLFLCLVSFVLLNERALGFSLVAVAVVLEVLVWGVQGGAGWAGLMGNLGLYGVACTLPLFIPSSPRRVRRLRPSATREMHPFVTGEQSAFSADDSSYLDTAVELACSALKVDLVALMSPDGVDHFITMSANRTAYLDSRVAAHQGVPGSVVRTGQAVVTNHIRNESHGLPLTPERLNPRHAMVAPIKRAGRVVSLLVVERWAGNRFEPADLNKLKSFAQLLTYGLAAQLELERVSGARLELERFFEASRMLNSALTPEHVYECAIDALRTIAPFELTLVTWTEPDGSHRVVHACGPGTDKLLGTVVDAERSLSAMVVKNGHYLPLGGEYRGAASPVIGPSEALEDLSSVVVLPLRLHAGIRGTLIVGSERPSMFSDQRRGMLEVIANQVSVSLANAKTYARVQEMATTDPLTGLYNRRIFHERLDEALARSERSKAPITLVLLDIDHFQNVNDTHGHPVGDQVLRELGATIRRMMRRTDTAARYGGEEFALILEDTDTSGALVLAERLRKETATMSFVGAGGADFSMTLSLGLAGFGMHAESSSSLVEAADQALYRAKRTGRNQSCLAEMKISTPPQASLPTVPPQGNPQTTGDFSRCDSDAYAELLERH